MIRNNIWNQFETKIESEFINYITVYYTKFHDNPISSNVDPGTNYDSIVITHVAEHIGDQQGLYNPPLKTEIYLPTGGSGQGDDTTPAEFLAILNAFTAKSGFAPIEF